MRKSRPLIKISRLYSRGLLLVEKEIGHLEGLAIVNKLPFSASKDLREYIKLLKDLETLQKAKEAEKKATVRSKAANMSEEELEALLNSK